MRFFFKQIYALRDPRNGEIRYVGQSRCARTRFSSHCGSKPLASTRAWIKELTAAGLRPELVILDGSYGDGGSEYDWIDKIRAAGADLLNRTCGSRFRWSTDYEMNL